MISTRPATEQDVIDLHPEVAGISYRAWVAELDGKPAGVIGLALTRPHACLFCGFKEELRPYLKSMPVLRLLKKAHDVMKERGKPVFAIRDANEGLAPQILGRLGFRPYGEVCGDDAWLWGSK